jgi:hypothetical protein
MSYKTMKTKSLWWVNRSFQSEKTNRLSCIHIAGYIYIYIYIKLKLCSTDLWCTAHARAVNWRRQQDKAFNNLQFTNEFDNAHLLLFSRSGVYERLCQFTSLISSTNNCHKLTEMETFWKVYRFTMSLWPENIFIWISRHYCACRM